MAFGFEIRNRQGEVVMNADDSPARLVREFNMTGTLVPNMGQLYRYDVALQNPSNFVFFKNSVVGSQTGALTRTRFYSSESVVRFRGVTLFVENAPAKKKYGLEIRNAQNQLVYTTAGVLVPIGSAYSFPGDGGSGADPQQVIADREKWFLQYNVGIGWRQAGPPYDGGGGLPVVDVAFDLAAIRRDSATMISRRRMNYAIATVPGTGVGASMGETRLLTGTYD